MNRSSMSKQMMQEGGPVVPSKEEFEAMSTKEKAARKKEAMMQNINLSPKEKMDKEKKEVKGMKKMNMGGMTSPMMDAPQSGPKKPMMPPKPKPAPRPKPKDPREKGSAMPMMKKGGKVKKAKSGGKVRGAGIAKQGVRKCKMR